MSNVSYMEKLLYGVEVEWKALGDVGDVTKLAGYEFTKHIKYSDTGKIIALRGLNVKNGYLDLKSVKYIDESEFSKLSRSKLYINDMLFTYVGTIGQVALIDKNDKYYLAPNVARIRFTDNSINPVFMKYYFQSDDFKKKQINRYLSSSSIKNLTMTNIRKFQIPIPCPDNPEISLKIQAEIVRILDAFTELTAELSAELTARKKQYNYYRDLLLTFEKDQVEWKTLEEVTLPTSNIRWRDTDRTYRYIDLTSVSRENNTIIETSKITAKNAPSRAQKLVEKNDVIFATTRPTQLRLCLINEEYSGAVASTGYCVLRVKSNVILPKWIYYHLSSSKFGNYVEENQSGSAYPAISDFKVKEFRLPLPFPNDPEKSLAEQARIVAILDKFDALTNSISEGLPREIELRQKQYEYYRDLLLSFPGKDKVV